MIQFKEYLIENKNESLNLNFVQIYYNEYNNRYFDGLLPKISFKIRSLKNILAKVDSQITYKGNNIPLRVLPTDITITEMAWSSKYEWNEDLIKKILLHEMIHVYLKTQGIVYTAGQSRHHGYEFEEERKKLIQKTGIEIPVSEDLNKLGLKYFKTDKIIVGFVYKKKNENFNIVTTFSNKLWSTKENIIRIIASSKYSGGNMEEAFFFKTNAPEFDFYPSMRSLSNYGSFKLYKMRSQDRKILKDSDIFYNLIK